MKKQHHNTKKSSPTAVFVIFITIVIAAFAGNSKAATTDLEKIFKHKVEKENLSTGVSIAAIENGKISFINVGFKDKKSGQKIDENTLFEIGSVSKTFTSTALATLVADGTIKLSDHVQTYLPNGTRLPVKNSKPITFESLANHTSGLPRLPSNMPFGDPLNPYADYTTAMLYEFLNRYELPREVGAAPEYSNLGSGLLGHTLALINNSNYEDMIKQRVLEPLNMTNTFVQVPSSLTVNRSKGHNGSGIETPYWQLPALAGAGALVSSAADMSLFLRANMEQTPLNKAFKLSQSPTAEFGNPHTKIGLAWIIQASSNGNVVFHNGQTGGFASFIGFNQQLNKGIVILSNTSIPMDDLGFAFLTDSMSSVVLNEPQQLEVAELEKLNGVYELMPNFTLTVTNEDNKLYVQGTGQPKLPLTAASMNEFVNHAIKARIVFERDSKGIATSLTLHQAGQALLGKKLK